MRKKKEGIYTKVKLGTLMIYLHKMQVCDHQEL